MNKFVKMLLMTVFLSVMIVGCRGNRDVPIVKAGLGIVTNEVAKDPEGHYLVNTTFAVVGLDKDGKIKDVAFDVAQCLPDHPGPVTQSKKDQKDSYGMKKASSIGKEWHEQIDAFETFCIGKTVDEVLAVDFVNDQQSDLKSSCTMAINDFQVALHKANENAIDVQAQHVDVGYVMDLSKDVKTGYGVVETTVAMVASDNEGLISGCDIDVAHIVAMDKADTRTNAEKRNEYGLKKHSSIHREWFEQVDGFEQTIQGMKAKDVERIATMNKDDQHMNVPKDGSDLSTKCTIDIGCFQKAVLNALKKR